MDRGKHRSAGAQSQNNEPCTSCDLSPETKELCREIGKILARIGDRVNSLQMISNGHSLHMNCRNGERTNGDTRPRPGVNKLP